MARIFEKHNVYRFRGGYSGFLQLLNPVKKWLAFLTKSLKKKNPERYLQLDQIALKFFDFRSSAARLGNDDVGFLDEQIRFRRLFFTTASPHLLPIIVIFPGLIVSLHGVS